MLALSSNWLDALLTSQYNVNSVPRSGIWSHEHLFIYTHININPQPLGSYTLQFVD